MINICQIYILFFIRYYSLGLYKKGGFKILISSLVMATEIIVLLFVGMNI